MLNVSSRRALVCGLKTIAVAGAMVAVPTGALAAPVPEPAPVLGPQVAQTGKGAAPRLVRELPLLRTRTSRTYLDAAGMSVARVFTESVNYRDEKGEWLPIDTDLVAKAGSLEMKAADYQVALPTRLGAGAVQVSQNDDSVAFSLAGAADVAAQVEGSRAVYPEVLPDVDLRYRAGNDALEEVLRLKQQPEAKAPEYRFGLALSDGLTPKLLKSGVIEFDTAAGATKLAIPAPVMTDAAGKSSARVESTLRQSGKDWELVLRPAPEWLSDAARKYPVDLDPTTAPTATQDCTLNQGAASTSFCGTDGVIVGDGNGSTKRATMRFDVQGALPMATQLLNATLVTRLKAQTTTNAKQIDVLGLSRASTPASTWNSYDGTNAWTTAGGDIDPALQAEYPTSAGGSGAVGGYSVFQIFKMTNAWLRGDKPNNGLLLKATDSSVTNELTFGSNETVDTSYRPVLDLYYAHAIGQRPWYKQEQFPLTDRLSLSVNAASGNVQLNATDVTIPGGLGPDLAVTRTYNHLPVYTAGSARYGAGWTVDNQVKLVNLGQHVDLMGPTGWAARYENTGGGNYTSPADQNNKLETVVTGGWKLTDNQSQGVQTFDANGNLLSAADKNGRRIRYEYTAGGGISKIVDSQERETLFTYTAGGLLDKVTDPAGREWRYGYNGLNQLTSSTNPAGAVTLFYYGDYGLQRVQTPEGRAINIEYWPLGDPRAFRVKRIMQVTGTTTTKTCNKPLGVCLTDADYTYTTTENGNYTDFTYTLTHGGSPAVQTQVTRPRGVLTTGTATDYVAKYEFDKDERLTKFTDGEGLDRTNEYDPYSNVQSFYAPYNAAGGSATGSTVRNYSPGGNLNSTARQAGGGTTLQSTASYGTGVGTAPGAAFRPSKGTDEQGNSTALQYNNDADVTRVRAMDRASTPSEVAFSSFDYSAPGKLSKITDANGGETTYGYDAAGNLTTVTPPLPLGVTNIDFLDATALALSRPSRVRTPQSRSQTFTYDALDRVKEITFADGTKIINTYDLDGNLTASNDNGQSSTYAYDRLGRIQSETRPGPYTVSYGYDANGNLATITEPTRTMTYDFDQADRQKTLSETGLSGTSTTIYSEIAGEKALRVLTTLPTGAKKLTDYDPAGRIKRVCAWAISSTDCPATASSRLISYDYSFSDTVCSGSSDPTIAPGRLLVSKVTDDLGRSTEYCYDDLGRLVRAGQPNQGGATALWTYEYDDVGNLTKSTSRPPGSSTTRTRYMAYNAANQLCRQSDGTALPTTNPCSSTTGNGFTYDAAGNELVNQMRGSTSTYNNRDQLTTFTLGSTTSTLSYYGTGQGDRYRVSTTGGSLDDRYNVLGLSSYGSLKYTRDETGIPQSQFDGTNRYWLIGDSIGSIRGAINSSNTLTERVDYDPYGEPSLTGSSVSYLLYAGGQFDVTTGLNHFGQRYYDPGVARFTQIDPVDQTGALRDGSAYGYAGGDPIDYADPTGEIRPNYDACSGPRCTTYTPRDTGGRGGRRSLPGKNPSGGPCTYLGIISLATGYGALSKTAAQKALTYVSLGTATAAVPCIP